MITNRHGKPVKLEGPARMSHVEKWNPDDLTFINWSGFGETSLGPRLVTLSDVVKENMNPHHDVAEEFVEEVIPPKVEATIEEPEDAPEGSETLQPMDVETCYYYKPTKRQVDTLYDEERIGKVEEKPTSFKCSWRSTSEILVPSKFAKSMEEGGIVYRVNDESWHMIIGVLISSLNGWSSVRLSDI